MADQNNPGWNGPAAPYGQDPYGQPPYGQDPYGQPPYGQNPYGQGGSYGNQQGAYGQQTPYGAGTYGPGVPSWQQSMGVGTPPNPGAYAHWGQRVGAYLIDVLLVVLSWAVAGVGIVMLGLGATVTENTDGTESVHFEDGRGSAFLVIAVGLVIAAAFWFYNWPHRQGRTGSTIGKSVLGIRVVSEKTLQPVGFGMTWLREILHYFVDGMFYIGYLWPLWDDKRQTFADKILSTIVIPSKAAPVTDEMAWNPTTTRY